MAQHDYIISNQTFPNTRADINNLASAIATNNSGTSAPTTQYAGQFWIDTTSTTWTLYIHDGTDDIQFATIDTSANTVNFTDSALDVVTDTTPQLGGNLDLNSNDITGTGNINITGTATVTGLTTTGTITAGSLISASATDLKVVSGGNATTNGSNIVFYGGSHATDSNVLKFRYGTTETMRIDSSGNVIIGTTTAQAKLHIVTTDVGALNNSNADDLMLEGTDSGLTIGSSTTGEGAIHFSDSDDADAGKIQYAHSSNLMTFRTNGANRMFIDSSGNVGIGTSSPSAILDVRDETNGANFIVGGSGTTNLTKIGGGGGDSLGIYAGTSTKVATFSTSGNTFLEGSLYLGGETSSANALDDYEEGDWTPNYSTEGGGESITYDGPTGKYIKVGQMVYITGYLRTDAFSGGSSYLYLGGFPFTNATGNAFKSFIGIARASNWGGDTPSAGEIVEGDTKAFLKFRSSANGFTDNVLQSDVSGSANSNVLFFSGTYKSST